MRMTRTTPEPMRLGASFSAEAILSILADPVFQPITFGHGAPFAFEALMRLKSGSHVDWLQTWERAGVAHLADLAMLGKVRRCLSPLFWSPHITVNVSASTIECAGPLYLAEAAQLRQNLPGLIVEITETVTAGNLPSVRRFAAGCRGAGIALALDDCQPGNINTEAGYIDALRPAYVKIDGPWLLKAFGAQGSRTAAALAKFIALAKAFGATVIAEHVESPEVQEYASQIGADLFQGFGIARPGALPLHLNPAT